MNIVWLVITLGLIHDSAGIFFGHGSSNNSSAKQSEAYRNKIKQKVNLKVVHTLSGRRRKNVKAFHKKIKILIFFLNIEISQNIYPWSAETTKPTKQVKPLKFRQGKKKHHFKSVFRNRKN